MNTTSFKLAQIFFIFQYEVYNIKYFHDGNKIRNKILKIKNKKSIKILQQAYCVHYYNLKENKT